MLHLLYTVILAQVALIMALLFKSPLQTLVIAALDKVKQGGGPVVVKTVAGTIFVVLLSSVFGMLKIYNRDDDGGAISPTDQVLMARHRLEASLMGFVLFLGLMTDRLHHYIREIWILRKTMETAKHQTRSLDDIAKTAAMQESKALGEEIAALKAKVTKLETDCKAKEDEAKTAQGEVETVRKQSEGLLLEYDRLLADNQSLQSQLQAIGQN